MERSRVLGLTVVLGLLTVILSAAFPFQVQPALAQYTVGATELAYDDGVPFKTIRESGGVCASCLEYQGVRFDLGGVEVAAITSVRFYASAGPGAYLKVHINDNNQDPLLPNPISVFVSRSGWYVVPIPEVPITGQFWVWVQTPNNKVMPYHDVRKDAGRSFTAEHPKVPPMLPVDSGDLMIRASVRAEIHVGKEDKYKYHTIQEAVDAAGPMLTIVVHPGTYIENVLVYKDLAVISSDGPSVTFVEAASPSMDVFKVTSDGVAIDGFTMRGRGGGQMAGVRLDDVSDCVVANNVVSDNYHGIYISEPSESGKSRRNVIVQNVAISNTYGIWVGGVESNVCGNRTEANTATLGSAIYLSANAANNWLRFNSFNSNLGSDQAVQIYYDGMFKPVDAIENWWGDPSGPYHASDNPAGTGAGVGEMVDFSPWLGAAPVNVATGTADGSGYVLDARAEASTSVRPTGSGRPIIWAANYPGNPAGEFPTSSIGKWMDVCLSDTGGLDEIEITAYYTSAELGNLKEGDLRLYWWNGSEWVICSNQKAYKEEACIRATIAADTMPGLSNLAGTPFAIGAPVSGSTFQWWWIVVGILLLVVLVIMGRFVLTLLSRGGQYDYE